MPSGGRVGHATYPERVRRALLSPRGLALIVIGGFFVTIFVILGQWQVDRARQVSRTVPAPATQPPVALTAVGRPGQTLPSRLVGRSVDVQGEYDAAHQLLVAGRALSGRQGFWVLTPLRVDAGSLGAGVAVVRGWVASPRDPATAVPPGQVTVTAVLQPSEALDSSQRPSRLPAGQVARIETAELIQTIPYPLYDGYAVLTSQQPPAAVAPAPVQARIVVTGGRGFPWQNAAYALQWWAFAAFVVFFVWRMFKDRWTLDTDLDTGLDAGQSDADGRIVS